MWFVYYMYQCESFTSRPEMKSHQNTWSPSSKKPFCVSIWNRSTPKGRAPVKMSLFSLFICQQFCLSSNGQCHIEMQHSRAGNTVHLSVVFNKPWKWDWSQMSNLAVAFTLQHNNSHFPPGNRRHGLRLRERQRHTAAICRHLWTRIENECKIVGNLWGKLGSFGCGKANVELIQLL